MENEDRLAADAKIPEAESTPHMLNFLEYIRTRQEPNAPIEAGYKHSVAVIMSDESLMRGRRIVYDSQKRQIREG